MIRHVFYALLVLASFPVCISAKEAPNEYLLFVGTYTGKESKGIYAYRLDPASDRLAPLGLVAETDNPSFLAVDPSRRFLYAVNELAHYRGESSGAVSAFAIDRASGKLSRVGEVPSRGADPCYLSLDRSGKFVLVANYTGGSIAVFPVLKDGRLGEASALVRHVGSGPKRERQDGPHAHWVEVTADNRFAMAADLGLDQVKVYRFDRRNGDLSPSNPAFVKLTPGAGPRHLSFHPKGRFLYVINELDSTVTGFSYQAGRGTLQSLQTISTLPKGFSGRNDSAEVKVHPNGKFLFASNRGHDSIAVFAIDQSTGTLSPVGHFSTQGQTPRNFEIDPRGSRLFVANQNSGNIVVFRIDSATGRLTASGQVLHVDSPVCLKFVAVK